MYARLERNLNTILSQAESLREHSELPDKRYEGAIQHIIKETYELLALIRTLPALRDSNAMRLGLANDLISPLASIIGFPQLILERPALYEGASLTEAQYKQLRIVLNCGKELLRDIYHWIDYKRIYTNTFGFVEEQYDLLSVINKITTELQFRNAPIPLKLSITSPIPNVVGIKPGTESAIIGTLLLLNDHSKGKIILSVDIVLIDDNREQIRVSIVSAECDLTETDVINLTDCEYAGETQTIELFLAKYLIELQGGRFLFEVGADRSLNISFYLPVAPLSA